MTQVDLLKDQPQLYQAAPREVAFVEVPPLHFLMADGVGDPDLAPEFRETVEALFKASYTLKFMVKKRQGVDYRVLPLEGLWAMADGGPFDPAARDRWRWTLMVRQPDLVDAGMVSQALKEAQRKKKLPSLEGVRFARFAEGLSAQVLHVGPYGDEAATMERLHRAIKEKGYHFAGLHHEIYLNDPRRTAPANLKTIIRQPVTLEAMK
ncbi:MAG: hypothetical protein FJ128_04480 [Deltaproteobacteria bacterium]|nr:hypothetical protein [Deltaproteobacteria bacterium]